MRIQTDDLDYVHFDAVRCDILMCHNLGVMSKDGDSVVALLGTDEEGNGVVSLLDKNGNVGFMVNFSQETARPSCTILNKNREEVVRLTDGAEVGGAVIIHKNGKMQKVLTAKGIQDPDESGTECAP